MSNLQRLLLVVGALVVLGAALILASPGGGGDDKSATATAPAPAATTTAPAATPPAPRSTTIRIAAGKPAGGIATITAHKGDTVRIAVTSKDTTSEVHLHGYDIKRELKAGGTVRFSFTATAEGIFEMELEETSTQIAKLVIEP
jgi:FtsP/CotA-like multicopper oxidase with cupredoxin domain